MSSSFIILLLIAAIVYMTYKSTRSILWSTLAGLAAVLLVPMIWDQFSATISGGPKLPTTPGVSNDNSTCANCS